MTELLNLQKKFIDVIKGNNPEELADFIVTQGSVKTLTRIEIYRNAYYLRLKECIETDHEILGYYLGDDLFDEMAIAYINAYPSQHTSLRYFCDKLPGFLAQTDPFKTHAVITELARFERQLLCSFDAADAPITNLEKLKQIAPEDWPKLHFCLHPSVQKFQADHNSVEIWQSLKQQQTPPAAENIKSSWVIWRNVERLTEFCSLNISEFIMLECIINGNNYAEICEKIAEFIPENEVSQASIANLVNWLDQGLICSISTEKSNS